MKRAEAGAILKYDGIIYQVVGYTEEKTLILRPLEDNKKIVCPHCGKEIGIKEDRTEVESCRNFQNSAEPVDTIIEV